MSKMRKKEVSEQKKKKGKETPSAHTEKKSKWQEFINKHAATKEEDKENNVL